MTDVGRSDPPDRLPQISDAEVLAAAKWICRIGDTYFDWDDRDAEQEEWALDFAKRMLRDVERARRDAWGGSPSEEAPALEDAKQWLVDFVLHNFTPKQPDTLQQTIEYLDDYVSDVVRATLALRGAVDRGATPPPDSVKIGTAEVWTAAEAKHYEASVGAVGDAPAPEPRGDLEELCEAYEIWVRDVRKHNFCDPTLLGVLDNLTRDFRKLLRAESGEAAPPNEDELRLMCERCGYRFTGYTTSVAIPKKCPNDGNPLVRAALRGGPTTGEQTQ